MLDMTWAPPTRDTTQPQSAHTEDRPLWSPRGLPYGRGDDNTQPRACGQGRDTGGATNAQ